MTHIVDSLKSPKVFVLGDFILDKYIIGSTTRISPEAPVPIVNISGDGEYRAGGAANVVTNLAAMGAQVDCGGVLGRDDEGDTLLALLKAHSRTTAIVRSNKVTPLKTRILSDHQQILRLDREDDNVITPATKTKLLTASIKAASNADLVIISDYSKGCLSSDLCRALIAKVECPVIVGLKGDDYLKYAGATGASLNKLELARLSQVHDVERGARKLLEQLSLQFLIVTLGKDGMCVYTKNTVITLPTVAKQVFDVTGAGDTALAAFSIGYASKLQFNECAILANMAAGVAVSKVGTVAVTKEELYGRSKIVTPTTLMKALGDMRADWNKVVFTNGCFDIVHAGHIQLLEFAKSKGDVLIVGLNSDDSIRNLKGSTRPIMPQHDRARLLAALEVVDYVVIFDELTPLELIRLIQPDVLVKGSDYSTSEIIGHEYTSCIELAPYMDGISTSKIVDKIKASS